MPLDIEGWVEGGWPEDRPVREGWMGVISIGSIVRIWAAVSDHLFGIYKYSSADRLFAGRGLPADPSLEVREQMLRSADKDASIDMSPAELVSMVPAEMAMIGPTYATWAEIVAALADPRAGAVIRNHPDRPSTLVFPPSGSDVHGSAALEDEDADPDQLFSDWNLVFKLVDALAQSGRSRRPTRVS